MYKVIKKYKKLHNTNLLMKIFFFKNKIKFLIPFDNNYYKFHFYDNSTPITFNSPLPNTYLKIDTLSIDCSIQLR